MSTRRLVLVAAVPLLVLLPGCRPDAPTCPGGTVAVWHDQPNSTDPDVGWWVCERPRVDETGGWTS